MGGGEQSSASLGFCVEAAFGWRPRPRAFCTATLCAQRRAAAGTPWRDSKACGDLVWASGYGHSGLAREAARILYLSPRGLAKTTGSFTCSSEPVADGGTLRPCAV